MLRHFAIMLMVISPGCDGSANKAASHAPSGVADRLTTETTQAPVRAGAPPPEQVAGSATWGRANRVDYEELVAGSFMDSMPVALCTLVRHPKWAGQGLYVVESLTGYTEDSVTTPEGRQAATYVKLTLVEGWYEAEDMPEARIAGGPTDSGGQYMWNINLRVGETVGLLLGDRRTDNRGFYDLLPLGVFKQRADGGYSNGQLFTQRRVDARELGSLVKGLAGAPLADPCPYDEQPDSLPPSPPDPEGISDPVPDDEVPSEDP
jgi:hypothetical protein